MRTGGGWFYNGGMENGKSLYIVGRGVLTPLFYEDPAILPIPFFPNMKKVYKLCLSTINSL